MSYIFFNIFNIFQDNCKKISFLGEFSNFYFENEIYDNFLYNFCYKKNEIMDKELSLRKFSKPNFFSNCLPMLLGLFFGFL